MYLPYNAIVGKKKCSLLIFFVTNQQFLISSTRELTPTWLGGGGLTKFCPI